jgi:hypothetical protein
MADKLFSYNVCVLPYYWVEFLKKDMRIRTSQNLLGDAVLKGWEQISIGTYEEDVINEVLEFFSDVGYEISKDKIVIANNHKTKISGQLVEGKYYINQSAITSGVDATILAVAEEMFHDISKCYDESRNFQNFLLDQAVLNMKKLRATQRLMNK